MRRGNNAVIVAAAKTIFGYEEGCFLLSVASGYNYRESLLYSCCISPSDD